MTNTKIDYFHENQMWLNFSDIEIGDFFVDKNNIVYCKIKLCTEQDNAFRFDEELKCQVVTFLPDKIVKLLESTITVIDAKPNTAK